MSDGGAVLFIILFFTAIFLFVRWAPSKSDKVESKDIFVEKNGKKSFDSMQKQWKRQRKDECRQRSDSCSVAEEKTQESKPLSKSGPVYYDVVLALVPAIKSSSGLRKFALRYPLLKISLSKTCSKDLERLLAKWVESRSVWRADQVVDWIVSDYCQLVERAYYKRTSELPIKSMGAWIKLLIKPEFWKTEEAYRTDFSNWGFPPDWVYRMEVVNWIDSGSCRRCGLKIPEKDKQTHHITPRAVGGTHEFENLALLCRDCHTFMPGRGHLESRGYGLFLVSKNKKVHTLDCRYAESCSRRWANLMTLKSENYQLCKVCDPDAQHQANINAWRPKIFQDLESRREEIVKELTEKLSNFTNEDFQ